MQDWSNKKSIFDAAIALHGSLDPGEVIHQGLEALSSLIPALLASLCRASGNETFSNSCTNAMTSPCLPQA